MAHKIIKADDVKKALAGQDVPSYKARQQTAKDIAANICQNLVFLRRVEVQENYFKDIKTLDELKAAYKKLALKNHPDCGGSEATMAAINAEYDEKVRKLAATDTEQKKTRRNKVAEKTAGMTDEEIAAAIAAEFKTTMDAIAKMDLNGVAVELIGSWLWVSGNTKPIKEELKAAGFRWCPKKEGKPWTWHDSYTVYISSKGRMSKQDIENKHGCQVLKEA